MLSNGFIKFSFWIDTKNETNYGHFRCDVGIPLTLKQNKDTLHNDLTNFFHFFRKPQCYIPCWLHSDVAVEFSLKTNESYPKSIPLSLDHGYCPEHDKIKYVVTEDIKASKAQFGDQIIKLKV